jgi:hypothetical protein
MGYKRGNHFVCIGIVTFAFLFGCLNSGFSQTAAQYVELGKAELLNNSLATAHTDFQAALALDPNHEGANFFYALTNILMVSNSTEFNTLLDRAGVSDDGRNILNWSADFARDIDGNIEMPADAPTGEELQSFLKNELLPLIDEAIPLFDKVGSGFQTFMQWPYETGEGERVGANTFTTYTNYWNTNEWVGYKLVVGGAEYTILYNTEDTLSVTPNLTISAGPTYDYAIMAPVEIDYSDMLVIKGGLNLAKAAINIFSSYNINVDIDAVVSLINANSFDVQTNLVQAYPQLLNLLPTNLMAEAKANVIEAMTQLDAAMDSIALEGDAQANDLFIVSANDRAQFSAAMEEWRDALDGPTLITDIDIQVDLTQFFDYPKDLRDFLPIIDRFPRSYGRSDQFLIRRGSFPDPTFGGIFPEMTVIELHRLLEDADILAPWTVDFNGDGKADLVWRNTSTGQGTVWYMDGVTRIGNGSLPWVKDTNWKIVGTPDYNNDGKPDLVWRNTSTGKNAVYYMNGVTKTGSVSLPSVSDTNWKIVGMSDFNGDDKPDIVWRNTSTGKNALWYMDGVTRTGSGSLPSVSDTNWKIVGTFYTGYGSSVIVWRNESTGRNALWYMDGVTLMWSTSLPSVSDTNWKIVGTHYSRHGYWTMVWRNASTGKNALWYMSYDYKLESGSLPSVSDTNWTIVP